MKFSRLLTPSIALSLFIHVLASVAASESPPPTRDVCEARTVLSPTPEAFGLAADQSGELESIQQADGTQGYAYRYSLPNGRSQVRYLEVVAAAEVRAALLERAQAKHVYTFFGYSGAGYDDPDAMLALARKELEKIPSEERGDWVVNIGATADGIGAVYGLAQELGFKTSGVVSSLGKKYMSPDSTLAVDYIFIVEDPTWGGYPSGVKEGSFDDLSPTSKAMVAVSDRLLGIGGGDVTGAELQAAFKLGKGAKFIEAESSRAVALKKWKKKAADQQAKGEAVPAEPSDFSSAAGLYLKAFAGT